MKVRDLVITGMALAIILVLAGFGWHAYMQGEVALTLEQMSKKRILITYYQRTNDVVNIGNTIHELVGGDMIKIEPEIEYPASRNAYLQRVLDERTKRTIVPLKTSFPKIKQYDIIFVGTPSPINTVAPPVKAFLLKNQKDLKHKVIIPFITYDVPTQAMGAYRDISFQIPEAYLKNPFMAKEGVTTNKKVSVSRWLKLMKFKRYEIR